MCGFQKRQFEKPQGQISYREMSILKDESIEFVYSFNNVIDAKDVKK